MHFLRNTTKAAGMNRDRDLNYLNMFHPEYC